MFSKFKVRLRYKKPQVQEDVVFLRIFERIGRDVTACIAFAQYLADLMPDGAVCGRVEKEAECRSYI